MDLVYWIAGINALTLAVAMTVYVVYPRMWWWLAHPADPSMDPPMDDAAVAPSLVLFISIRNEETVLRQKLENSLALRYAPGRLRIVVLSDGSTDSSIAIAQSFANTYDRIELIHSPEWRGKNALLRTGIGASSEELVAFTDANAMLDEGALVALAAPFREASVGCVTGNLILTTQGGSSEAEAGSYWRGETRSKLCESRKGWVVASNGALLACRRELVPDLRNDTANDFLIPLTILSKKLRSLFAEGAIAREPAARRSSEEAQRKERIMIRGMTCTSRMIWKLPPLIAVHLLARKVLRWLAPPLMLLGLVASSVLAASHAHLTASAAFAGAALTPWIGPAMWSWLPVPIRERLDYAAMLSRSTTRALSRFLTGTRVSTWVSPSSDRILNATP